jgi:hypothetical protein
LLRLACLALIAVLTTGCAASTAGPPEEVEEVIDDTTDGAEEDAVTVEIAVCVEKAGRTRADYRPCQDEDEGYAWYFYTGDATVPAVGRQASGGTFTGIDGADIVKASPKGGAGAEVAIEPPSDWVEVCVEKPGRERVPNNACDEQQDGYGWYYIAIDGYVPAVGRRADNGTFTFFGGDTYRARQSGGDAVDAAIDYEEEVVDEE